MITFDSHTHSAYSFDTENDYTIDDMCQRALSRGITHLAITDHYDINAVIDRRYPSPDFESRQKEIDLARERYRGRLTLSSGIEMGSAIQYPEQALTLLDTHRFDTVLASVHFMRGHDDFYYWDMSGQTQESFRKVWLSYLTDIEDTVDFGHAHVLSHLSYPLRYYVQAGLRFDISFSGDVIERIMKKLIAKDMLLEVNSSGFYQGMNGPLPDAFVLSIYRDCGGRLISTGSDAHSPDKIAAHYGDCLDYLKKCGFHETHFAINNEIYIKKI